MIVQKFNLKWTEKILYINHNKRNKYNYSLQSWSCILLFCWFFDWWYLFDWSDPSNLFALVGAIILLWMVQSFWFGWFDLFYLVILILPFCFGWSDPVRPLSDHESFCFVTPLIDAIALIGLIQSDPVLLLWLVQPSLSALIHPSFWTPLFVQNGLVFTIIIIH